MARLRLKTQIKNTLNSLLVLYLSQNIFTTKIFSLAISFISFLSKIVSMRAFLNEKKNNPFSGDGKNAVIYAIAVSNEESGSVMGG